ncbi:tRNA (adenosine(37)-N6)-dimethylallyltransferase MiaA [bacterium SCSIO 12741]|nr:tRNA (adenosine(37)-N6)-dimethylallyltransferase MiaA [bacterium SCSIO 12741]
MISQEHTLLVVTGPTAVGKTELTIRLSEHFQTEIISADSRQFYQEMSIGTAKPTSEELARAKHHFIHSHTIKQPLTVGQYEPEALQLIEERFQKHKLLILTGGSGLFIDAVCKGMDPLPSSDPKLREEITQRWKTDGIEWLQNKLQSLDPEYFAQVDQANPHRLIRGIEVCLLSGKTFSELRSNQNQKRPFRTLKVLLNREREELYDRINRRVDIMAEQGLEEEAKALLPYRDLPPLQTVGYREFFDYFDGKCTRKEALDMIRQNSRRYAKRQLTWFRRDETYQSFHPDQYSDILQWIENQLN